jgi:hypothetical protein
VIAQAANAGATLTTGGSLTSTTSTGSIFTFSNSNNATGNRAVLNAVAGSPNGGSTVPYVSAPTNSGIGSTYYAAIANATSGTAVGSYGWANTQTAVPFWGVNASTGATNWSIGVLGTSTGPNGRAIMGQVTGAPTDGKLATGVFGEATSDKASGSTTGKSAGVTGTVSASAGSNAGVYGYIPSTGSSAAYGVKGENLNTTGGVGVYAYTASSSGRALYAMGSVYIENQASAGSATSATDIILARTNSGGYCGFNSAGQSFNASDRTVKENFESVSNAEILEKLVAMPITKWNFKKSDETVKYVGPMAQDFHAAFGLGGSNERVIHATNAQGITMAALQGLNTKVEDKSKALEAKLDALEARIVLLERALDMSQNIATGNLGIGMAVICIPAGLYRLVRRRRD